MGIRRPGISRAIWEKNQRTKKKCENLLTHQNSRLGCPSLAATSCKGRSSHGRRPGGVRQVERLAVRSSQKKISKKIEKTVDESERSDILTIPLDKESRGKSLRRKSEQLLFDSLILVCRFGKIQNVLYSKKHIQQMLDSAFFR